MNGKVSDSMLVNTILMLVYVTKFFWWEAGYWNTMDIAHDRGMHLIHIQNYIIIIATKKVALLFGHSFLVGSVYMANAAAFYSNYTRTEAYLFDDL